MVAQKTALGAAAAMTIALLPFLSTLITASPSPSPTRPMSDLTMFPKRQQQDPNTPLVLDAPACNFFQCSINITQGQELTANWLNAPEGTVALDLLTDAGSRVAYPIASGLPAIAQPGYCDAGSGLGTVVVGTTCGQYSFIVPSAWVAGNYSMRATSETQPQYQSYTDVILIFTNQTNNNIPFSVIPVSGAPTNTITQGNNFPSSTAAATAPTAPGASAPANTASPAAASSGAAAAASGASSGSSSKSASANAAASASSTPNAAVDGKGMDARTLFASFSVAALTGFAALLL